MRDQMDLSPTWPNEHGGWVNTPGVKANVHEHLIETNDIWVSEDGSGSAFYPISFLFLSLSVDPTLHVYL